MHTNTITENINVTKMDTNKRRSIFTDNFNRSGFTAFIKTTQNNQTYYIFKYEK